MVLILRMIAWFGIGISCINACLKLFADDATVLRYAGSSRNLDVAC